MSTTPLNSAYTFSCTFFNASTGASRDDLTVNVQLYDETGAAVGSPVSATKFADDRYTYTPAENVLDAYGKWMAEFVPTDTTNVAPVVRRVEVEVVAASAVDLSPVLAAITGIPAAVWAFATANATVVGSMGKALVDFITYATTKLALITAGAVNFTAPVDPDTLTLTIVRGDDYSDDSGRTLPTWESDDWSVLDLSAATSVTFKATTRYGTVFSKAMDILSDTQVRLQLTTAETAALGVGTNAYRYDLEAVLSAAKGSDIITLAQGMMTVREDVR